MPEYTVCLARQDGDWVEVAEGFRDRGHAFLDFGDVLLDSSGVTREWRRDGEENRSEDGTRS